MAPHAPSTPIELDEQLLERLFDQAGGGRWGLSRDAFADALRRSLTSHFHGTSPAAAECRRYLESLHLEDLALAVACGDGLPDAWGHFVECFRPALRRAAFAIAGESGGAELADGLYADLYGLEERDGRRRSLFDYFHGRSRLSTWLRAVLAQAHVDRARAGQRLKPLDESIEREAIAPTPEIQTQGETARFAALAQTALVKAIGALAPADRLRLSFYYLQRQTLARIGRLTGEHEATVSRKLDRTRRELRTRVEQILRDEHLMSEDQVRACLENATEDTGIDLAGAIGDSPPARVQEPGG